MRFPIHITTDQVGYQIRKAVAGETRYPLVLMLEPLYTCNLACVGCSTERHTGKLADRLPVETCLRALDECGAPTVSICGGEPTLYPELAQLLSAIIERKKHIYLCTNGLVLDTKVFGKIAPHKRLTINVHLDGMRETHDKVCARDGVFDKAIEMIKEAKQRGYHVTTNTTVFKETSVEEIEELCKLVKGLGVDGLLVSPGYHYESVKENIFLTKQEIHRKFRRVLELSKEYRMQSTPMYLEFAAGMREYDCSPWSTVTFTPKGWKKPCYLIGDEYVQDWTEFWTKTDWAYWESRVDEKCQNCAMHSGFEASAVRGLRKSPKDMLRMAAWNFLGVIAIVAAMPEELAPLRARLVGPVRSQPTSFGSTVIERGRLGEHEVALAATGDGARNARDGIAALLGASGPRALIVIGVSGALSPELATADLVVASRVIDEEGRVREADVEAVAAATRATGGRPAVIMSARRIVDSVEEKRRLAQQAGGGLAVVDLESASYVAAAEVAGIPWLVLRAVSDTAGEALPPLLNRSLDAGGAVSRGRVLRGLLGDPGALPVLLTLRKRVAECAGVLARAAEAALPTSLAARGAA